MSDEMDLLSQMKSDPPIRPDAYEEARAVLRAAIAVEEGSRETVTARPARAWWASRRTAGVGALAVGAAAAAAIALVVTSAPAPGHPATATSKPAAKPTSAAVNPILVQLAANITVRQVELPGNATLEIRNQSPTSGAIGGNGVDLYTDDGTYYWALSKSMLPQVIAQKQDVGEGQFKRAIAAAVYAVTGDIDTARARMAIANLIPGAPPNPALARQALIEKIKAYDKARHLKYTPPKPLSPAQKVEQTDNFMWMNATDALIADPGSPQVRAGVLRIMATMPNVKVTHTITAGQPTLTVADSWPLFDHPVLVESLVINASTGFPIAMFNVQAGQPLNATYYHTVRVTLANVAAGKL